ncbi:MAG TPA: 2-C-methyl-D-erythritol 4-phosphate cytidylyltransferase [Actinobacteria bacterium]|nr:2-C-methyl-D-erythritol 4-phosphate cytidylyltransferase [Actinomycetota bacterium]
MRTIAVVLAGGSGRRFGGMPKQLRVLAGRTLLEHCVDAFDQAPAVDEILVVIAAGLAGQARDQLRGYRKLTGIVPGGEARSDSTRAAIAAIVPPGEPAAAEQCNVLFHDAARPLIDQQTIAACVAALDSYQAVGVVVASPDTIVEVADQTMRRVLPRQTLARCQTPQGFRLSVIRAAYQRAAADPGFAAAAATDDCGVVLRYLPEVPVGAVTGSERNIKITYEADLTVAEALLRQSRPGSSVLPG